MIRKILAGVLIAFAALCTILQIHLEMLSLCALFFALVLLILSAKNVPKKGKTVIRIAAIIALAALTTCTSVILISGRDDDCEAPSDFVVVLGAQTIGEEPDITLRERLDRAVLHAKVQPSAVFFVSGGQGSNEIHPEGEVMQRYLVKNGVAPERVVAEPYAKNTRENLIFCRELAEQMGLDTKNPVIITSDYHILRAKYIAKTLSMQPTGLVSKTENAALRVSYAVREVFAFIKALAVATWS